MSYGLEVHDENGELVVDNEKLMNRVYYQIIANSEDSYYYPEPINYKPPIMQLPIGGGSYGWYLVNHIQNSSNQYIGFSTIARGEITRETIITVFKIK